MRGFYSREQSQSPRGYLSWSRWIGVLCIALVLLVGIVQVVHTLPNGQIDESCSLCVTAHHVVQTVALVTLAIAVRPVLRVAPEKTTERPRQRFLLKLAIRPPPVSLIAT
jgi:hypothetical protein